jgi:hypothetical protein
MVYLLVLAVALFLLGLLTVKLLWWAALALGVVWVAGQFGPGRRMLHR